MNFQKITDISGSLAGWGADSKQPTSRVRNVSAAPLCRASQRVTYPGPMFRITQKQKPTKR